MSTSKQEIKDQRDRFLAFSFASSDVLLETDNQGIVNFSLGASQNLVGKTEEELQGSRWLDLFEFKSKAYLKELSENAKSGRRIGPVFAELLHSRRKALFSAIKMPADNVLYITIGVANELADLIYENLERDELLTKETLNDVLEEKLNAAKALDIETSLTFLDLNIDKDYKDRIGKDAWNQLTKEIAKSLNQSSLGGDAAGQVSENRYTVLHEKNIDTQKITAEIQKIAAQQDPEGAGISVDQKTVDADIDGMSIKEASRAIIHTLNEFERKGAKNMNTDNLSGSFEEYVNASAEKLKELKKFIDTSNFSLYFQPIVDMETGELSHYETLTRFSYGNTQEWVVFSESVNMAAELDLAICDKLISYIRYKAGNTRTKFAVNISGQSITNDAFFKALKNLIAKLDQLHERLSFEITESYEIDNLQKVASFVDELKAMGFQVALDDFGAGSASLQYLQELNVDTVKIDGKYIRNIRESQRDVAIVKNITNMCKDMGVKVIAEYVENQEIVQALRKLGIVYGQGYHYSKPRPAPDYINENNKG